MKKNSLKLLSFKSGGYRTDLCIYPSNTYHNIPKCANYFASPRPHLVPPPFCWANEFAVDETKQR